MRKHALNLFVPTLAGAALLFASLAPRALPASEVSPDTGQVVADNWTLMFGNEPEKMAAAERLIKRGKKDIIPAVLLAMRFVSATSPAYQKVMKALTGEVPESWHEGMLWLERHPEVTAHETYRPIKMFLYTRLDPKFLRFLGGERSNPKKMKIRNEEIAWGGVRMDGIPSLDNPKMIPAAEATYMVDTDEVFGVAINGDVRAYPLRIMGWHEMFNEVIGGVPVALAYCTLCGSGILYETKVDMFEKPLVFGSSGFLYRSNKLMFDRHTLSLWNQFTGKPVNGPLVDSGIELKVRPVTITSWKKWRDRHPDTKVLALETGYDRDYRSGAVYADYFASDSLMFPAVVRDESVAKRKDFVFGLQEAGGARAWPLKAFAGGRVINDEVGTKKVVLIGDAATRTVRAYYRGDQTFEKSEGGDVKGPGGTWKISEDFLNGPDGTKLPRATGGISFWFAWENYFGDRTTLFKPGN